MMTGEMQMVGFGNQIGIIRVTEMAWWTGLNGGAIYQIGSVREENLEKDDNDFEVMK